MALKIGPTSTGPRWIIHRGASFTFGPFVVVDLDGAARSLVGCTVRLLIGRSLYKVPQFEANVGSGIVVADAPNGELKVELSAQQTGAFEEGGIAYELLIVDQAGAVILQLKGQGEIARTLTGNLGDEVLEQIPDGLAGLIEDRPLLTDDVSETEDFVVSDPARANRMGRRRAKPLLDAKADQAATTAVLATKADATATATALALKAPLTSPAFTGSPTAPTPSTGDNSTRIATTAMVRSALAELVASSPAALDTLNELAAALGNDPNFAATMLASLAAKQNSILAPDAIFPGSAARQIAERSGDLASIKDRGAIGNGVAGNRAAFLAAIADPRPDWFLPPGTYRIESDLDVDISNKRFWAVPGTATIVGSNGANGASLLKFRSIQNVGFHGINFENPSTNQTYDATDAIICSLGYDVIDLTLDQCELRAPGTGGQLIALYPNTTPNQANKRRLDGLRILNCLFDGAGQHAITLMNRTSGGYSKVVSATSNTVNIQPSTLATFHAANDMYNGLNIKILKGAGAGQSRTIIDYAVSGGVHTVTVDTSWTVTPDSTSWYEIEESSVFRLQNVWIQSSIFRRLGLAPSGTWKLGFAASFDGAGTGIHFLHNAIEDTDLGALELSNTFRDSEVVGNTLKDNGTSLTEMSGFAFSSYDNIFSWMRNISVRDNKCLNALAGRAFFGNMENSIFDGNLLWADGSEYGAAYLSNLISCLIRGDHYLLDGASSNYALTVTSSGGMPCESNKFDGVRIEPRTTGNGNGVIFIGTAAKKNTIRNSFVARTGTGIPFGESSGASSNQLVNTIYSVSPDQTDQYVNFPLSDANTFINEVYCQHRRFRFTGTLSATRIVYLLGTAPREYLLINETSQTLTISTLGVTYSLAAGARKIVTWTGNAWYVVSTIPA